MKKINIFVLSLLSVLLVSSCADKDPRIGELLNEDLTENPNISVVYLKNKELPYSEVETSVTYMIASEHYKDVENDQIEISLPVEISKPLSKDITIEVVEDKERSESLRDKNLILVEGKQITPKVSKVLIKAGETKSVENALFVINLKELSGSQFIFPVTLKIEEGRKDCIVSRNFKSYDIKLAVNYSMDGILEMKTQLDPSLKEIKEAENLRYGFYANLEPYFFDHNLSTAAKSSAYYNIIQLVDADVTVKAFSIQPRWSGSSFDEIAKGLEVFIIDESGEQHNLGTCVLPDFSKASLNDNPMIVFELKKPINIQGLFLRDVDREKDGWRTIYISEFRLYI